MEAENSLNLMIWNISLIIVWNICVFLACIHGKKKLFDSSKRMYRIKSWEKDGKFYSQKLKIKKWKDFLPQYVSKGGFSKKSFESTSIEYIDRFILETCRGEWAHRMCLLISVPIYFFNKINVGVGLVLTIFCVQLPFIFIQRYNRIRLQKLKERLQKDGKERKFILNKVAKC